MDFTLTTEQRLFEETVERLARDRWAFDRRARQAPGPNGYNAETWSLMADLGLLGVPFGASDGGHDGGSTELMILHRALGRGLSQEPYLATVVLAGGMVANLGDARQRANTLPDIMNGRSVMALAYLEPAGRYNPLWVETHAVRIGAGYRLTGHKAVVLHGDAANRIVVTARTSGKSGDRSGLSAFLVDAKQPGVHAHGYATIDGRRAAEIRLDGVDVPETARLGTAGAAAEVLERVLSTACAALCAESVGAMEVACDMTLEYLKTRHQFGVPIGRFQVLQHRMVDMRIALEKATSMAILAACSLAAPSTEREHCLSAAKCLVGKTGKFIAEQAIQIHGGMGMTDETAISHYAKSLIMLDHWLGDADYHLAQFIAGDRARDVAGVQDEHVTALGETAA